MFRRLSFVNSKISSDSMIIDRKGTILVLGDFNLPKFSWIDFEPSLRQDCTGEPVYECFTDILDDFNLVQMVTQPTRQDHILDLFLTTNQTLVTDVTILPGLGDHDIVSVGVAVKPTQTTQKRRKIHQYNKANWTTFRSKMRVIRQSFSPIIQAIQLTSYGQTSLKTLSRWQINASPQK